MSPTIVLISGASRGLGKGLLEIFLARPNHIVIAANRNADSPTSKALNDLPKGSGSRLIVVKVDSTVESEAFDAAKQLEAEGIDHLDIVIANAGISFAWPTVADLKVADLRTHMESNVYGVIWLYQATAPLLRKSDNPKWITMGSGAGWLEVSAEVVHLPGTYLVAYMNQYPAPNAAYAPSKVAVHWLTKRINGEEDKIAAFITDPGWVQTDTGNTSAKHYGFEQAPLPIIDSVTGLVSVIDVATKESHGGQLWGHDGKKQAW
ncbi:hypothetical protein B0T22DRAFT_423831 [Podospora appendiculata]|uniref:Aflatoxin biosynthesis ketoreductase nor-1 n=1 Tax=Podospora appendiculata TaxID=314037 RepID=A0AAE1CE54_9PEZI|nr:hypothetical protein B0T22DRAFT_423831 [Podospora appendiculata]